MDEIKENVMKHQMVIPPTKLKTICKCMITNKEDISSDHSLLQQYLILRAKLSNKVFKKYINNLTDITFYLKL